MDALVAKCPFLSNLAKVNGTDFAISVATAPFVPAPQPRRPLLEEQYSFSLNYAAFHHPQTGAVPLVRPLSDFTSSSSSGPTVPASLATSESCPWLRLQRASQSCPGGPRGAKMTVQQDQLHRLPLATMSLSFGGSLVSQDDQQAAECLNSLIV